MKISEITSKGRTIVKKLNILYYRYVLDIEKRDELLMYLKDNETNQEPEVRREINLISIKLQEEILRMLRK